MTRSRRLACCLAAAALAAPATAVPPAHGQDAPPDVPQLSDEPQLTPEPSGPDGGGERDDGGGTDGRGGGDDRPAATPAPDDALPNTGADALVFVGLGVAMLLCGTGLRLRTIDEDAF